MIVTDEMAEAMQMAVEALVQTTGYVSDGTSTRREVDEAIDALRAALEAAERKRVAELSSSALAMVTWDERGAIAPVAPYSWESVARVALDTINAIRRSMTENTKRQPSPDDDVDALRDAVRRLIDGLDNAMAYDVRLPLLVREQMDALRVECGHEDDRPVWGVPGGPTIRCLRAAIDRIYAGEPVDEVFADYGWSRSTAEPGSAT